MTKKIPDLPSSNDDFWEGAEKYEDRRIKIPICSTHAKDNWMLHLGYIENRDGTVTCKYCGWGFIRPGYLRIKDEKVFDLRRSKT